jgi:hypothetical protein
MKTRDQLCLGCIATSAAALLAASDYRRWRSLGPGGAPPNLAGWTSVTALRALKRESVSPSPYDALRGVADDGRWLPPLAARSGPRPRIDPHPIPQRQIDQPGDKRAIARRPRSTRVTHARRESAGWRSAVRRYAVPAVRAIRDARRWRRDSRRVMNAGSGASVEEPLRFSANCRSGEKVSAHRQRGHAAESRKMVKAPPRFGRPGSARLSRPAPRASRLVRR